MYDKICMTHNRLSNFYSVHTIMQVVLAKFIKVVLTDYSAFIRSSKIIQEQAVAAVVLTLISEQKQVKKKRKKKKRLCETLA